MNGRSSDRGAAKILILLRSAALCVVVAGLSPRCYAAQPPEKPILRIEAGMHTGLITRMGLDAAGRYLATGSLDKTVRVWDMAHWVKNGTPSEPVRTLRPPIGPGKEGAIYAVAMSPDGKTVACGGYTGGSWGKTVVYLFDRRSGKLKKKLPLKVSNSVNHLAYSKDGRYLAAALGGRGGIRIFRASGD